MGEDVMGENVMREDVMREQSATNIVASNVEITAVSRAELDDVREEIVDAYRAAFSGPPYNESDADVGRFVDFFASHVERAGFTCFVARELSAGSGNAGLSGNPVSGHIVGWAHGYTCQPGQWWYDTVSQKLAGGAVKRWMVEAFELVELGVRPSHQGCHLGSRLHDALFRHISHRTALLSTMTGDTVARRLYNHRGWQPLLEPFHFPGVDRPYAIMGLDVQNFQRGHHA